MNGDEYAEDGQNNERERRERRKKKHRKSRDVNPNDDELYNGTVTAEFDNDERVPDLSLRRSEEENYEPVIETKRKHRHRRSRTEDVDYPDDGNNVGGGREEEDQEEDPEEARRIRREKRRRARELKKAQDDSYQSVQSPSSEVNNYPFEAEPEQYNPEDEQNYVDPENESLQEEEEEHISPPPEEPKPKKKSGGFGKIFASFKKKNKTPKAEVQANAQWESNPEIFNPAYDSQPGTLEKSKKKVAGKSGRDISSRNVHIILLDGEEVEMNIDQKSTGANLFDKVCEELDLIEKDFFGMTYANSKLMTWFWLDVEKKINKQLGKDDEWTFNFQVKFYPPEPVLLQEDITRYLLSLQVRQDVFTGKLPCSWITQALLGSFMVQSELGDYDELENGEGTEYLREFEFVLNQSEQLLEKICELHKKHIGMSPDKADIKYLETAKRLEQYGVDLHPARDNDDVEIFIGVSYQGILIYRDRMRIGRFAWPKVLRISYKKNYFYLKIRSDRYDDSVAIVGFKLLNHNLAKRLWKNAAEQHTFFRMKEPQMGKSGTKLMPTAGSTFGYSGKTLHQYRTMNIARPQPAHFDRSLNKRRTIGSMPAGLNQAGMQYSSMHSLNRAHPRDMTLGKTKSVDYLNARKPGSMMALPQDKEGSIGSFSQSHKMQPPMPYGSVGSYKDSDRRQSFHSGDSLNGGDSYRVNHDQLSLPPMSPNLSQEYAKPVKKHRSKHSSNDGLSDDGMLSPLPREPIKQTKPPSERHRQMLSDEGMVSPLPREPIKQSKPALEKQRSRPSPNEMLSDEGMISPSPREPIKQSKPALERQRSRPSPNEMLSDEGMVSPVNVKVGRHRSKPPPNEVPSDDDAPVNVSVKPSKMAPLPQPPPEPYTSESETIDSNPKPRTKKYHSKTPASNQNSSRPMPQFKPPPPPPPEPIPDPPSISSSTRSSQIGNMPPLPPAPEDLPSIPHNSYDRVLYTKTTVTERSRPPVVKPKPTVKPKPNVTVTERTVVTKTTTRRGDDYSSNDDML